MVEFVKGMNFGIAVSFTAHLCALSLLMAPSSAYENKKPLNMVFVDFLADRQPFGKNSGTGGEKKLNGPKKSFPRDKKEPRKAARTDRPVSRPSNLKPKTTASIPAAPMIVAPSVNPGLENTVSEQEYFRQTSVEPCSDPHEDWYFAGAVPNAVKISETSGIPAVQRGSYSGMGGGHGDIPGDGSVELAGALQEPAFFSGGAGGSGLEGSKNGEYLAEGSEDYNFIRDEIIKNIKYPDKARRQGLEGRVLLSFVVLENGTTNDVRVIRSSNYRILDENAKKAVAATRVARKLAYRVVVRLPISYRLQ